MLVVSLRLAKCVEPSATDLTFEGTNHLRPLETFIPKRFSNRLMQCAVAATRVDTAGPVWSMTPNFTSSTTMYTMMVGKRTSISSICSSSKNESRSVAKPPPAKIADNVRISSPTAP